VVGHCEGSNEHLGSIKYEEFLDYAITSRIPKKDCAPWSK